MIELANNVSIHLNEDLVNGPPYVIHGRYVGTEQLHDGGQIYVIVEGTIGDYSGKMIHTPERLIHYIEQ